MPSTDSVSYLANHIGLGFAPCLYVIAVAARAVSKGVATLRYIQGRVLTLGALQISCSWCHRVIKEVKGKLAPARAIWSQWAVNDLNDRLQCTQVPLSAMKNAEGSSVSSCTASWRHGDYSMMQSGSVPWS